MGNPKKNSASIKHQEKEQNKVASLLSTRILSQNNLETMNTINTFDKICQSKIVYGNNRTNI